jgi:hypothetical protein
LLTNSFFNINKTLLIILLLFVVSSTLSQIVYEPLHRDVYNFLARLSQRGVIEFHDEIRPLARKYIAEKLLEAEDNLDQITTLEIEELEFFKKDFFHEIWFINDGEANEEHMNFFSNDPAGRWRFFSYGSEAFKVNLSLILGAEIGSLDEEKRTHFWNGFYTYAYIKDVLGVSFDFRDNAENGTTIDKDKRFSPVTGVNERSFYPFGCLPCRLAKL